MDKFPSSQEVIRANFPHLSFEEGYADEVLLRQVLEHARYTDELVICLEMVRVLKPGGIATVEVPDISWCAAQFLGAPEPSGYTDPTMDYNTSHKWGPLAQSL